MTLCIAWRDEYGNINLASDSRVTVAQNSFEDVAVKITRIPCEIFPPGTKVIAGAGAKIPLGMAFAGSHICAYVIKETLVEILSRLCHIPNTTELSMDKICKIAFFAYKNLSKKVCSTSIGKNGICELFIIGFCPKTEKQRAFKFSTSSNNTHQYIEILTSKTNNIELSGSGKNANSLQPLLNSDPVRALKAVINDHTRPDVGGSLQYGLLSDSDFEIFCECLDTPNLSPAYMRAGLDIYEIISTANYDDLFIAPRIADFR
ncbi:hypothetical protein [Pantoea agglomerans]